MRATEEKILSALRTNAELYARYAGTYLTFIHARSRSAPPQSSPVYFGCEQFMHLVGIRSETGSAAEFYERCLNGAVKPEDCTPTHSVANRNQKIAILPLLFDFSRAKIYQFGDKDLSTKYNDFTIATGNRNGTIGYDNRDPHIGCPIPVTLLTSSLQTYCSEVHKLLAVVQQAQPTSREKTVIYERKDGVLDAIWKSD